MLESQSTLIPEGFRDMETGCSRSDVSAGSLRQRKPGNTASPSTNLRTSPTAKIQKSAIVGDANGDDRPNGEPNAADASSAKPNTDSTDTAADSSTPKEASANPDSASTATNAHAAGTTTQPAAAHARGDARVPPGPEETAQFTDLGDVPAGIVDKIIDPTCRPGVGSTGDDGEGNESDAAEDAAADTELAAVNTTTSPAKAKSGSTGGAALREDFEDWSESLADAILYSPHAIGHLCFDPETGKVRNVTFQSSPTSCHPPHITHHTHAPPDRSRTPHL